MAKTVQTRYTHEQITAWLRGLLAIAWADGHFDAEEQDLIHSLIKDEIAPRGDLEGTQLIQPDDLAIALGPDPYTAENFMRMAVMVAIADGTYSPPEDEKLQQFCIALKLPTTLLDTLQNSPCYTALTTDTDTQTVAQDPDHYLPLLNPVQEWLDHLDIQDPRLAKFLCKMIPPQCPFERDVKLFGHKVVHIPPLCKLNPLYEQLVGLRFRALSYLADDCGEDVTQYC